MKFLEGLDRDLRDGLLRQIRDRWTHHSTGIEGNTLTLSETAFVIEEGLTIAGKPLRDHQEVVGHAKAIDLIYGLLERERIDREDLFEMHRAVQTEVFTDAHSPIGGWKTEPNGTNGTDRDGNRLFIEFSPPLDTPTLMERMLVEFNRMLTRSQTPETSLSSYCETHIAFTQIHPFFDGNGRMARLISNLPLLKSGHPPVVIPNTRRKEYIESLSAYSLAVGPTRAGDPLVIRIEEYARFEDFCREVWRDSWELVETFRARQTARTEAGGRESAGPEG